MRERERERALVGKKERGRGRKKGSMATETVFKEGRQSRWRPNVIQGHQRHWRPSIHVARPFGSRWIPRVPLSLTPFCSHRVGWHPRFESRYENCFAGGVFMKNVF
jgi:hypothetical protein